MPVECNLMCLLSEWDEDKARFCDACPGRKDMLNVEALKRWTGTGLVWTPFPSSLSWLEVGAILMMVEEFGIRSFFEIGTHRGGLSAILYLRARFDKLRYSGIEIEETIADTSIYNESFPKFNLRIGDVWKNLEWAYSCLMPSPSMVFCDGGNKQREVDTFAEYMNSRDFILAHDYMVEWERIPKGLHKIDRWYLENTTLCLLSLRML